MSTAEKTLDERWSDMSDLYLKDAHYDGQSMHGRCTCAFEAGYFAVLRCLGPGAQHSYEHPDVAALRAIGELQDVDVGLALQFMEHRYDGDMTLNPTLSELLEWAHKMRVLADSRDSASHELEDSVYVKAAERRAEKACAIEVDPDHL